MLHILLLILKIIGIVLAVLIGLIVLLLAIVLFVPIRYTVSGQYYEKPKLKAQVYWLFHLLRVYITYDDELDISAKFFFFRIYSSDEPQDNPKQEKTDKQKRKKNTDKTKEDEEESDVFSELEQREQIVRSESNKNDVPNEIKGRQTCKDEDKYIEQEYREKEPIPPKSRFETVREGFTNFVHGIIETFRGILNKSISAKEAVQEKLQKFSDAVNDEENKELVSFLWKKIKKLFRIIKPKKYRIKVRYGFEEPETTGWLAVRLAVIYGLLGMDIELIPDFEQQIFGGEVYLRGRMMLFGILLLAGQVYFNRLVKEKLLNKF